MSEHEFGKDPTYDAKCVNCFIATQSFTAEQLETHLQKLIADGEESIRTMGPMMERCCMQGYSWTAEMESSNQYYRNMIKSLPELLDRHFEKDDQGKYNRDTFHL